MSSYSLNPNVPQSNYTPAPITKASANATPPAVAKAPPASSEKESLTSPKNLAIGAGGILTLGMIALGIRNRNFKFWEDAVGVESKNLKNTVESLETRVAETTEEISELKKKGTKKPAGDSFDDVDDSVEDTKPEKGKGWFQWFSGKAEEKKPPVAQAQDLVISFETPSKPDPSKRSWTNWFPKDPEIPIIDPNNIPQELVNQRFSYAAVNVVYKKNETFNQLAIS